VSRCSVSFGDELERILPLDVPNRSGLVALGSRHLALVQETNQLMNLTRITNPREAVLKHVLDSIIPWPFFSSAKRVLDVGTGAGFPGIPLSIVFPEIQFVLAESVQKKARFLETAVEELGLPNVTVEARRAEEMLKTEEFDIITARAVAPLERTLTLFQSAISKGSRALLYKGPDAEAEIADAAKQLRRYGVRAFVVLNYDLPFESGSRSLVEILRDPE
jgi:16S rRNA (guanine527-N7)-methyltransferase